MNWNIAFDESNQIVIVRVEGKIQAAQTAEMAIEGINIAREKNCNKFFHLQLFLHYY